MKRIVLIAVAVLSMFWLGGCMVIEYEEYGPPEPLCVVPVPPPPVVEVIHVPGPPPWPYHHHYYHRHPRRWR
jgi:hypothetical protein